MGPDIPVRSGRPLFKPRKNQAGRGLRRVLTYTLLSVLVVVAAAVGWLLYVTNNGGSATASVGKNTAPAEAAQAPPGGKPGPAPASRRPAEPAPQDSKDATKDAAKEAAQAKPPASSAVQTASIPPTSSAAPAVPAPAEPQGQAPAAPEPAAAPVTPRPLSGDNGPSLIYCYQGKVPDPRLLVVDKSRQRLMVLRYMGEMTIEVEFPCATGMQPGSKQNAGDERTPEGVYFTTHRFEDNKITIFGDRAIHLDYPNPFDQCANRDGNGIFLHGTDKNLKPRSSNGCVVMRNEDLAIVAGMVKEQFTPIIVVDHLVLPKPEERIKACDFLQKLQLSSLERAEARLGPQISLLVPPPQKSVLAELDALGQRLAGFDLKETKLEVQTHGLALFGLGNNWVVVADQRFKGGRNEEVNVTRRFYLGGDDLAKANLLQGQWVVADTPQARMLASWAPPLPPAPPVVVAAAKTPPVPAAEPAAPAPAREPAPVQRPAAAPPAPPAPAAAVAPAGGKATPEDQLRQMLAQWVKAWEGKNLNSYISFYAADFRGQGMDREAWRKHKAYLNNVYKIIGVEAKDVRVEMVGTKARVSFTQHYRSDWHRDVGRKTLELALRGGHWQITRENWEALPGRS